MNMPRKFWILPVLGASLVLTGCSSFDEAIGKAKSSPDEFQVVVRPPLTLPPNFSLRPGDEETEAASPIGTDAVSVSSKVLTNAAEGDASSFDALFGTDQAEEDIRRKVDEETLGVQLERRLPVDIIFGGQPNVGPNLSASQEAARIRKALETGESVTSTPTPAIDPVNQTPVAIE